MRVKRILLFGGPAEPGQFRPGGRVQGQQEVAVVGETLGTGADVAVHETGILAEQFRGQRPDRDHRSVPAPEVNDPAVSGILIPQEQHERCPGMLPLPDCTARSAMPSSGRVMSVRRAAGPGLRSEVLASPATRLDHGLRCIWPRRLSGGAE